MSHSVSVHTAEFVHHKKNTVMCALRGPEMIKRIYWIHAVMGRGCLAAKDEPTQSISACGIAAAQQQRAHSADL